MKFDNFIDELKEKLKQPLPGLWAQLKMAPPHRPIPDPVKPEYPKDVKFGSVLILLYPDQNRQANLVLTLRQEYKGVHSGQISLPGGKVDKEDSNLEETAIREAEEEIGIERTKIEMAGRLSELYIPPSNFLVHPFIGISYEPLTFYPQELEVAQVIETGLDEFLSAEVRNTEIFFSTGGFSMKCPSFNIQGHVVWGATAMILSEFRELVRKNG